MAEATTPEQTHRADRSARLPALQEEARRKIALLLGRTAGKGSGTTLYLLMNALQREYPALTPPELEALLAGSMPRHASGDGMRPAPRFE